MVICEETNDILLARWVNQHTGKMGGIFCRCPKKEKFSSVMEWMASELAFDLPIHNFYLRVDKEADMLEIGTRSFRKAGSQDKRIRMVETVHIYKHWDEKETAVTPQQPEKMGIALAGPLNFYIATKRANKASKRRFTFQALDTLVWSVLIGEKSAAKKLADEKVYKE